MDRPGPGFAQTIPIPRVRATKVSFESLIARQLEHSFDFQVYTEIRGRLLTPGKFYKKESQEKTLLQRPDFFLLPSPHD
jgi:hypothetical protein